MKIKHRPYIEGLKALSILLIIFYHSKINIFENYIFNGGIIGYDILFVLSGYLISSLILNEFSKTKKFSFKLFYKNRIKKILPVLLFVIFFSFPFAWYLLLPTDLINFSKSIITSLSFISNFFFHYSASFVGEYNAVRKPFHHTWALSILVQFYFLFPIFFFIILKLFKKYVSLILTIIFTLSLGLCLYGSTYHPSFNFYILPTRLWEFVAGCMLANSEIKINQKYKKKFTNNLLPFMGLLIIVFSFFYFNKNINTPSIQTIIPVFGILLLIGFEYKNSFIYKLLTNKFFVFIGTMSYSIYVWHHPVLAFARISQLDTDSLNILNFVILLILIFALSALTFYLIEQRFKNKIFILRKFAVYLLISFSIIFILNIYCLNNNGILKDYPKVFSNSFKNLDYRIIYQDNLPCHYRLGDKGFCEFNSKSNSNGNIILLGDSISDTLLKSMIKFGKVNNFKIIHMSYSGNLYLPGFMRVNKDTGLSYDLKHHEYRKKYLEKIKLQKNFIIIIGNYVGYFKERKLRVSKYDEFIKYPTNEKFVNQKSLNKNFDERIRILKKKFKAEIENLSMYSKVILVYPLPQSPFNVLEKVQTNYRKNVNVNFKHDKMNIDFDFFYNFNEEIFEFFDKIKANNLYKIYPHKKFCDNNKCYFYDNNEVYFFDHTHPSYKGGEIISEMIVKEILKIKKN